MVVSWKLACQMEKVPGHGAAIPLTVGGWTAFENGCFRLRDGDDDSVGEVRVDPCHCDDNRRTAMEQNKRLADYRQYVIGEAVAAPA